MHPRGGYVCTDLCMHLGMFSMVYEGLYTDGHSALALRIQCSSLQAVEGFQALVLRILDHLQVVCVGGCVC